MVNLSYKTQCTPHWSQLSNPVLCFLILALGTRATAPTLTPLQGGGLTPTQGGRQDLWVPTHWLPSAAHLHGTKKARGLGAQ